MEKEQVQRKVARSNLYWELGPDKAKVTAKLQQEFFHPGEQTTVKVVLGIFLWQAKELNHNREILHKIGVTGSKVETRIANASLDPTFLMAEVEVIASYQLYNINRVKLENIIHRVFDPVQLDIEIKDRFGNPVRPREWFLVPLFVVNEAVERIKDGTITQYVYDPTAASLVKVHSEAR